MTTRTVAACLRFQGRSLLATIGVLSRMQAGLQYWIFSAKLGRWSRIRQTFTRAQIFADKQLFRWVWPSCDASATRAQTWISARFAAIFKTRVCHDVSAQSRGGLRIVPSMSQVTKWRRSEEVICENSMPAVQLGGLCRGSMNCGMWKKGELSASETDN